MLLWLRHRAVGIGVTVISLVAIGVSTSQSASQLRYQRCVNRVTEQLVAAQQARAAATDARDQAWDDFVDSSLKATTPEEKKAALDRWLAAREHLRQTLREHPLPGPPRERC